MRNLYLNEVLRLPAATPQHTVGCCMSVDYDTGAVYIATDTKVFGIDPRSQTELHHADLVDGGFLPADGSSGVVGIQHIPDQMAVCITTGQGDVILWSLTTGELECVGSVDSGLTAMAWSPDQELVVLTTGQGALLMMTRELDPLLETSLFPDEFGEAQFINVGWGKKTTQFHGSAGKQAATKTQEDVKAAFSWDDKAPRITWRGDGQYFAITVISPATGARQFRVWTRDGALHSTGESVSGLEQALAWKPSGSLIASSQRKPNKHDIVFFELNGLQHGEFMLPFKTSEVQVKEILWNTESTVLAVWCEQLPPDGSENFIPKSYVQLWTVNNYHWYLKQNLAFESTKQDRVVSVLWDPEHAYRLHILCGGGQYLQYTWSWVTNSSRQASVAVIDGDKVLMTPFKKMVVPPPMSAYQLQLPCAVNQVAFAPPSHSDDMAVILCDGTVAVYTFSLDCDEKTDSDKTVQVTGAGGRGFSVNCATPKLAGMYRIKGDNIPGITYPLNFHHFLWSSEKKVLFSMLSENGRESRLCQADLTENTISVSSVSDVGGFIFTICRSIDSESVAVQLTDGSLLKFSQEDSLVLPWETSDGREVMFPQKCSQTAVCSIAGEEVILGLTERYRFYVNDTEVASNCTSFGLHDEFLLLTTHAHTCRCICRKTKVSVLPTLSDGKTHPFDESVRRVERGSRLVTVVPDDMVVALQMPRGNLEVIHPRALVLSVVRHLLDSLEYKKAFTLMRKHRINMNLLHDHDPQTFLNNTKIFVRQLDDLNHINLFLTDLQEDDVTVTMYTAAYDRTKLDQEEPVVSKVDTVCDAVRNVLEALNPDKFLLSILTSHVRKREPELELALHRIQSLKGGAGGANRAEEALKYLLFLVDVNELYDVALGTYDFELVLMVAEKSQKDPKEYLPFLNTLRKMEEHYQKYHIDKYLKRYSRALQSIAKCGDDHFEECVALIREHRLYKEALTLFPKNTKHYKEIAVAFAEYLAEKRWYEESAILFFKAEDWESALEYFEKSLNWQQAFCMATKLGFTSDRLAELGRRLAKRLNEQRRQNEAASILEQYVGDVEEAIVMLIDGGVWEEALRLMHKYNRLDFVETNLKSALVERHSADLETIKTLHEDFDRHRKRLVVVRQEKEQKRLDLIEGTGNFNDADGDLFSDTSSATGESVQSSKYTTGSQRSTIRTKSTGRSNKNRRKADRKKWSLKEGSQYEDLALIEALSNIISHVEQIKAELAGFLKILVMFDYESQALELQDALGKILEVIEISLSQIWDPDADTFTSAPVFGPESTANTIAQALQRGQGQQSSEVQLDPSLKVAPTINRTLQWQLHQLEKSHSNKR